ncbi:MAG: hypothetical protein QM811_01990 [Pirellulales bacterium]
MRRRLQFSLLGFLLLVAAVAVGVKWWQGPHRVVERTLGNVEIESTFYRDWNGGRILDGPHITRLYDPNGKLTNSNIQCCRRGTSLKGYWQFGPRC